MSSFAAKRKARKITVQEDDEGDSSAGLVPPPTASEPEQEPPLQATFKSRKPFKQSSLRRSINVNESDGSLGGGNSTQSRGTEDEEEDTGSPVVRRPQLGRSASTKSKSKRQSSSSRLSFGPSIIDGDNGSGDDDGDSILLGEQPAAFTPKKPAPGLIQTASENSAIKKAKARNNNLLSGLNRLAMRSADSGDDNDDGRPRYSKEYLSELQNSTPNTPSNIKTLHRPNSDDEMSLDPSELEGAMIVDSEPASSRASPAPHQTTVLTEAEIREKKERRARLAKQGGGSAGDDFISLSDDDNDSTQRRAAGESYLTVLSRQPHHSSSSSKKKDSRLRPEDEDLGEGFDEFVEDGGLSLGRKAERAARRKQRADIASMIETAE
ncbi:nineteen complex-related protein 2-domain-containing protein, partial [Microdochium bolleyi]